MYGILTGERSRMQQEMQEGAVSGHQVERGHGGRASLNAGRNCRHSCAGATPHRPESSAAQQRHAVAVLRYRRQTLTTCTSLHTLLTIY